MPSGGLSSSGDTVLGAPLKSVLPARPALPALPIRGFSWVTTIPELASAPFTAPFPVAPTGFPEFADMAFYPSCAVRKFFGLDLILFIKVKLLFDRF
jgi:hypothetical protein